jgi:hypothetical protein
MRITILSPPLYVVIFIVVIVDIGVLGVSATDRSTYKVDQNFGYDAHKISAYIAEQYFTESTWEHINKITGNRSIVEFANWADDIRNNPNYSWSSSYHYVNPEHNPLLNICSFSPFRDCEDGECVIWAIYNYTIQLKTNDPMYDTFEALKFLVHFVVDIHQPLHVCGIYKGGNDFPVKFYNSSTNLHKLWDSQMMNKVIKEEMSDSVDNYIQYLLKKLSNEWFNNIPEWLNCGFINNTNIINKTKVCPDIWAIEIEPINCSHCWKDVAENINLEDAYYYHNKDLVGQLIAMSGIRLASILNEIF